MNVLRDVALLIVVGVVSSVVVLIVVGVVTSMVFLIVVGVLSSVVVLIVVGVVSSVVILIVVGVVSSVVVRIGFNVLQTSSYELVVVFATEKENCREKIKGVLTIPRKASHHFAVATFGPGADVEEEWQRNFQITTRLFVAPKIEFLNLNLCNFEYGSRVHRGRKVDTQRLKISGQNQLALSSVLILIVCLCESLADSSFGYGSEKYLFLGKTCSETHAEFALSPASLSHLAISRRRMALYVSSHC